MLGLLSALITIGVLTPTLIFSAGLILLISFKKESNYYNKQLFMCSGNTEDDELPDFPCP